jgi:hypothetical protein
MGNFTRTKIVGGAIQSPHRVERREIQPYYSAATIMLSHGIPPLIVAGMLGHSISIPLVNTYAHFIPTMQDEAAQLMDDILTPIPIELERIC